jgi:hypothetical protein
MAVRSAMVKPSRRRQSTALVIISGTTNSQKKRKLHTIKKHNPNEALLSDDLHLPTVLLNLHSHLY